MIPHIFLPLEGEEPKKLNDITSSAPDSEYTTAVLLEKDDDDDDDGDKQARQ